jgi:hypothetical protein
MKNTRSIKRKVPETLKHSQRPWQGKKIAAFYLREHTWWDTRSFLAEVILAGLKQFANANVHRLSTPMNVFSQKELEKPQLTNIGVEQARKNWQIELDKMVTAFTILVKDDICDEVENREAIDAGLLSFAKHFQNLWD